MLHQQCIGYLVFLNHEFSVWILYNAFTKPELQDPATANLSCMLDVVVVCHSTARACAGVYKQLVRM